MTRAEIAYETVGCGCEGCQESIPWCYGCDDEKDYCQCEE